MHSVFVAGPRLDAVNETLQQLADLWLWFVLVASRMVLQKENAPAVVTSPRSAAAIWRVRNYVAFVVHVVLNSPHNNVINGAAATLFCNGESIFAAR